MGGYLELGAVGVFLLHDTVKRGVVVVGNAVAGVVLLDVAVGETDRAVGIGAHESASGVDL